MGFEPTTVGLEVRRSIQTELRALEYESTMNGYKQLGFYSTRDARQCKLKRSQRTGGSHEKSGTLHEKSRPTVFQSRWISSSAPKLVRRMREVFTTDAELAVHPLPERVVSPESEFRAFCLLVRFFDR